MLRSPSSVLRIAVWLLLFVGASACGDDEGGGDQQGTQAGSSGQGGPSGQGGGGASGASRTCDDFLRCVCGSVEPQADDSEDCMDARTVVEAQREIAGMASSDAACANLFVIQPALAAACDGTSNAGAGGEGGASGAAGMSGSGGQGGDVEVGTSDLECPDGTLGDVALRSAADVAAVRDCVEAGRVDIFAAGDIELPSLATAETILVWLNDGIT